MSNVIKFFQYTPVEDKVLVESGAKQTANVEDEPSDNAEGEQLLQEAAALKEQILQDAESYADQQVRDAMEEAARIREQADAEIREWWDQRRSQDSQHVETSKQNGFDQGYAAGLAQAEQQVKLQFKDLIDQAKAILEQSYRLKEQTIQESEPFLIELSCAIAEKIVARQLTLEPEWTLELVQSILTRRKEKGIITLCVSPLHFAYIQDAKEELVLHIDSQAELQIIPDASVTDHGCVVRSSFGSIDARVDTQLQEIKNALRQLAIRNEGM
ncbi:FliH/SctL family protein [Paenibacillus thalictri]|uniref:Flagellar assembly protein FliH n=1 Tax=Paenibacillus thalictri TaxID=2527873 RepID=A0A4Q9DNS2_9BACL|nr:FliH/SctL family protein [Paenibacillus thalictri]TBL77726.1 flagellar assembly protein FliH [Paenibacillus thalictri]